MSAKYLNLGCGRRYHPAWTNYDLAPQGPGVVAHDLSLGVPEADGSVAVVYHSHVLEHLRREQALPFLRECYRVLERGGIVRVVVPDLERLCLDYLSALGRASQNEPRGASDHKWMTIELLDQLVRERNGGAMLDYLSVPSIINEDFIVKRIGEEGREILQSFRIPSRVPQVEREKGNVPKSFGVRAWFRSLRARLRQGVLWRLLGPEGMKCLDLGRFRLGGEVHCWMYDRFSLAEMLKRAGFVETVQQQPDTSYLPTWKNFNLDTLGDGTVVKPDSLFMEARKP